MSQCQEKMTAQQVADGLAYLERSGKLVDIKLCGWFHCPICGYGSEDPPDHWNICSCCGIEFNYEDLGCSHAELRRNWIDSGMKWWSCGENAPKQWNPDEQLKNSDLNEELHPLIWNGSDYVRRS